MLVDKTFDQPRLQSSQEHFSKVPSASTPRSIFNRDHQKKLTMNSGYLVPFFVDEVIPGDTMTLRTTTFARLATPKAPFMDNLDADIHYWFVPDRLLQANFQRMMGEKDNPTDSIDFEYPVMTAPTSMPTGYEVHSVSDYMGIPIQVPGLEHVSMWHRAYNFIYNTNYRDQNLQDSVPFDTGDGPDDWQDFVLLKRGKRHDYFTGALPFTQKGPASVLPLGDVAPVVGLGKGNTTFATGPLGVYETGQTTTRNYAFYQSLNGSSAADTWYAQGTAGTGYPMIYADLSQATAATINQLREAVKLQEFLERDARGGTRYVELLKSHFGVISPDFRLQRPEYLGGGTTKINQAPIPQTSATSMTSPQGNLTAMGTFGHNGVGFNKSFVEHGRIIGLMSIRADQTYQQGLPRMFSRRTRYDLYWPTFAHLGEQAILNKEIYAQGPAVIDPLTNEPMDDSVFGYQERYAEYRYKPSEICGMFRSVYAQSLDFWHLAQEFESLPELGSEFIEVDVPLERVIAVPSAPEFLVDILHDYKCARAMPVYSVPGWGGKF